MRGSDRPLEDAEERRVRTPFLAAPVNLVSRLFERTLSPCPRNRIVLESVAEAASVWPQSPRRGGTEHARRSWVIARRGRHSSVHHPSALLVLAEAAAEDLMGLVAGNRTLVTYIPLGAHWFWALVQ